MRIGLYAVPLHDRSLNDALARMAEWGITDAEIAVGGFVDAPHCDAADLLAREERRAEWLDAFSRHGIRLAALNANGNPLHPDRHVSEKHARDVENAIRLAPLVGVDRVIVMPGAPGGDPGAARTGWYVTPWESGPDEAIPYAVRTLSEALELDGAAR